MVENKKKEQPPAKALEDELRAIEEQTLLYAKDLARVFRERKEKERQLALTKRQLARSARIAVLGELAAGIAHEINNILTPATGSLSILLMDRSSLSQKVVERLELMEQSLTRATHMLQQVLDLSRKKPEKREHRDVSAVLGRSLSLLKYRFTKKQINVEKNLQSDMPQVWVDDAQIEQVFTNLSLNAINAMDRGDTLRITTSYHQQGAATRQPYVQILFEDTGCGIPPENMEHVFEPFFTTRDKGSGTGLGLFICHGIVEKHGGTIDVMSTPNVGTQFKVCLPVS